MTSTLSPLAPPFSEAVETALSRYPRVHGRLLSLFLTFARSERFLRKGVPDLLDRDSPLSLRIREIVILRVTAHYRCAYEWGIHAALFAQSANLTQAELSLLWGPSKQENFWSPTEAALIQAVDDLCTAGTLRPETRILFESDWTMPQQLEIMALCGAYHTVSLVANVARLAPEHFAYPPPQRPDEM